MNNKNWKYCSPDKDELYQASCIPAAQRAEEHPTPAPKWGLDEGFAAVSSASRKAKKLPQVKTIPTELWRAIKAANGGELSEEDISAWKNIIRGQDIGTIKQIVRGQLITLRKGYQMPTWPANKHKSMEKRHPSNEVGLDLIILDDIVHVSTTEEIDQINERFTGKVIYILPSSDEEDEGVPYDSAAYHQKKSELIQQYMNGDSTAPMILDEKAGMDAWCRHMMELIEEKAEDRYEYSVYEPVYFSQSMDLGAYLAYAWGVLAAHEAPLRDFATKEHEATIRTSN